MPSELIIRGTPRRGDRTDPNAVPLSTKQGTWINNTKIMVDADIMQKLESEGMCKGLCPEIKTRSLCATYNCFGLVFGSRRCDVFADSIEAVLKEDYTLLGDRAKVCRGDIVVYRSARGQPINHVGIVFEKKPLILQGGTIGFYVLSQWGYDGEYLHLETHVPNSYGDHREYYTERPTSEEIERCL